MSILDDVKKIREMKAFLEASFEEAKSHGNLTDAAVFARSFSEVADNLNNITSTRAYQDATVQDISKRIARERSEKIEAGRVPTPNP